MYYIIFVYLISQVSDCIVWLNKSYYNTVTNLRKQVSKVYTWWLFKKHETLSSIPSSFI